MTEQQRRENIRQFISAWSGKGQEDQDDKQFWLHLIKVLFGIGVEEHRIDFQKRVKVDGNTKKIDAYIPETKVLIEQKSFGIPLDKKIRQSGQEELTPFEQALRYNRNLSHKDNARWIVTCNFAEFWIYDMNQPGEDPTKIQLNELLDKYPMFDFLLKQDVKEITEEVEVSVKAGNLVGKLYDALKKQYDSPESEETLKSLNMLCVRLVFLLYAEDEIGVFNHKNLLREYLSQKDFKSPRNARAALIHLFEVLDQDQDKGERDKYLADEYPILSQFPYVNGDLFKDKNIEVPPLTEEIIKILLVDCSENFDWSKISPTIFGAVFESTLNLETRRSGGMHYTSIENIHKVIDPLFLDELKDEFEKIKKSTQKKTQKLKEFHDKLANLKFLDPACGSGNFLTETYMCLRRLENEVIKEEIVAKHDKAGEGQMMFSGGSANPIRININQFYGIEINDFAVSVARAALWIAEAQMLKETMDIVHQQIDFLPLTTNASIIEANALRIDWDDVLPASECNYIMGNPPFIGYKEKSQQQKEDLNGVCVWNDTPIKNVGSIDYVAGWYYKASQYAANSKIHCCFVSTNSITQGEQVSIIWKTLIELYNLEIIFAYKTFIWDSEASLKAHVYCVIIGFCFYNNNNIKKCIFDTEQSNIAKTINPYLIDSDITWISSRRKPIQSFVKSNTLGVHIFDNHNFIFTKNEKNDFIKNEPLSEKYFKKWVSASDFLNGKCRYYLDLSCCSPHELQSMPSCKERIKNVIEYRHNNSSSKGTSLEENIFMPKQGWKADSVYIAIPNTTSERRRYIPITFFDENTVLTMPELAVPNGDLYDFGILNSNVHMSWVRVVAGRLKGDFRYSGGIVYNNFPWPNPIEEQKGKIELTAQGILDARDLYPDSSLADLYDPLTMPPELRKAHQENDRAVMQLYGFDIKNTSEADCVAKLMEMYQKLIENEKK